MHVVTGRHVVAVPSDSKRALHTNVLASQPPEPLGHAAADLQVTGTNGNCNAAKIDLWAKSSDPGCQPSTFLLQMKLYTCDLPARIPEDVDVGAKAVDRPGPRANPKGQGLFRASKKEVLRATEQRTGTHQAVRGCAALRVSGSTRSAG